MSHRNGHLPPPRIGSGVDDLAQAAKAITDTMRKELHENIEQRTKSIELDLGLQLGKSIEREVDYAQQEIKSAIKALDQEQKGGTENLRREMEQRYKELSDRIDSQIELLRKSQEEHFAQLKELLGKVSAPTITINVPELKQPQIKVDVAPAAVHIPEIVIPKVEMPKPEVTVNLPKFDLPAPVVNVTAEAKPPDVVVNVPKQDVKVEVPPPRLVKKKFSYDQAGRPLEVREEEIKE